jgi:ZIP family zinc transporter
MAIISTHFSELIILTLVIGFSIFISFPVVYARRLNRKSLTILTAVAIGILFFLLADIFGDVAATIYPAGSYVANLTLSAIFIVSMSASFLFLYGLQNRRKQGENFNPMHVSTIVAIAIGFQNLTEGLVFGATWAIGLSGLAIVIFVGFVLQNFTEGFPIVSPFLGSSKPKAFVVSLLFLVGAIPTIAGSILGYFYSNSYLNVAFDALAIGSILYVLLPMLKSVFTAHDSNSGLYLGLLGGFLVGFLVNII